MFIVVCCGSPLRLTHTISRPLLRPVTVPSRSVSLRIEQGPGMEVFSEELDKDVSVQLPSHSQPQSQAQNNNDRKANDSNNNHNNNKCNNDDNNANYNSNDNKFYNTSTSLGENFLQQKEDSKARLRREWKIKNKEKQKKYNDEYKLKNSEKLKMYQKMYREIQRQKQLEQERQEGQERPVEGKKKYHREYEHTEQRKEYKKEFYLKKKKEQGLPPPVPNSFSWKTREGVRQFLEFAEKKYHVHEWPKDWYRISMSQVKEIGGIV